MSNGKFAVSQTGTQHAAAITRGHAGDPSRGLLSQVSIIIPIGPDEQAWPLLLHDLAELGNEAELLIVGTRERPEELDKLLAASSLGRRARWISATAGRARQLNAGAEQSARPFLWYLHADCRVTPDALHALDRSLALHPNALHYFDLQFQDDGPRLTRLNALGARIRSRWFGMPFGDQGFCLSGDVFQRLGGFDEAARFGEDHLLVWAAHRLGVPLRRVDAAIATSARKYRENGWLATTLVHGWRTWRQAAAAIAKLLWSRIK